MDSVPAILKMVDSKLTKIGQDVADAFYECWDVEAVAKTLALTDDEVVKLLNESVVQDFLTQKLETRRNKSLWTSDFLLVQTIQAGIDAGKAGKLTAQLDFFKLAAEMMGMAGKFASQQPINNQNGIVINIDPSNYQLPQPGLANPKELERPAAALPGRDSVSRAIPAAINGKP